MTTKSTNKAKADAFFGKEPVVKDPNDKIELAVALNWLRSEQTPELNRKWLQTYMKQSGYNKTKIESVMSNLRYLSSNWFSVARILTNGSAVPEGTNLRLNAALDEIASYGVIKQEAPKVAKPKQTSVPVPESVLTHIDLLVQKSTTSVVDEDVYAFLMNNNVTKSQVEELIEEYKSSYEELMSLDKDESIQECYADYTPKQRRNIQTFFKNLYAQFEQYKKIKQTRKKAVKKPRKQNKEKLIAKLRYMKESPEYRIASVDPMKLIGAKTVVLFNNKTRDVSVFYAEEQGISVKGTSLVGFDAEKSLTKRLRKPNDVLSHGVKAGLEKAFGAVKSVARKANGRMNENTIIVKVWN